ncbi:hypothetical protein AOLI_G00177760 [Acnodon oligacanthus]
MRRVEDNASSPPPPPAPPHQEDECGLTLHAWACLGLPGHGHPSMCQFGDVTERQLWRWRKTGGVTCMS